MRRRGLLLVLALAAAGCGQTGELFLPEDAPPPTAGQAPAPPGEDDTTTNDDDEEDQETPAR